MGPPFPKREQFLYVFTKDEDGKVSSRKDLGVYFIPMTGTRAGRQALSRTKRR